MSAVPVYRQLVTMKMRLGKATIFTVKQLFLLAAGGDVCLHVEDATLHHRTNTEILSRNFQNK